MAEMEDNFQMLAVAVEKGMAIVQDMSTTFQEGEPVKVNVTVLVSDWPQNQEAREEKYGGWARRAGTPGLPPAPAASPRSTGGTRALGPGPGVVPAPALKGGDALGGGHRSGKRLRAMAEARWLALPPVVSSRCELRG